MFKIFRKNKEKTIEQSYISNNIVPFIINEDKKDNILLGKNKNNGMIYVAFKDNKIAEFLNAWFPILKMRINNEISEKYYDSFINSVLNEYEKTNLNFAKNKLNTQDLESFEGIEKINLERNVSI